ncbi:glycosyltransferase [Jidongwangia harbinensis]|uniref:glycosyltransferase n=1 Tax=Jidongwangia harbinensis TaxID=2878561 RepID=UPI001CDA33B0|nr:glycosyltransferase [Jidongwangia harbinensis]MCA2211710.1 glycosyltransferase [Jidongwangia harbinensis]
MPEAPCCTVIVPTYNRSRLLSYTLDSLVRQDLPARSYEVVVVDDGSSDDTAEVVAGYRHRLDIHYHFQPDDGYRVARARNTGITHARAPLCVFLDSGVIAHTGCLSAHVERHLREPRPVALCGYVFGYNLNNEDERVVLETLDLNDPDSAIDAFTRAGEALDHRDAFYRRYGDDFGGLPAPWLMYWTSNASAATDMLREVGGFDEQFQRWGGEDVDLGYRLYRAGARIQLERRATAIHYPHDKVDDVLQAAAAVNYRYIARKYDTPITRLLAIEPMISFFALNELIERYAIPNLDAPAPARSTADR